MDDQDPVTPSPAPEDVAPAEAAPPSPSAARPPQRRFAGTRAWFRDLPDDVVAWKKRHELGLTLSVLLVLFLFIYFFNSIVISIHAGERGVLWSRFVGTWQDELYPEGLHIIFPWDEMQIYNLRYQRLDRSVQAMSKDGLAIDVDITIRFKPELKNLTRLHQQVGPDYAEVIIVPQSSAAVRAVIGRYRPDELYTASFVTIQRDVAALTRERVRNRFVYVDDVMIRTINIPPVVAIAIQRKLEQEQASLEMHYRIGRERQEADRKRIEAEGIRAYHDIVSASLSPALLQFKGVEATLALSQSPNSKVIVIGGKDGLPIILNPDAGAIAPAPPVTRPPAPPPPPSTIAPAPPGP